VILLVSTLTMWRCDLNTDVAHVILQYIYR